jgi:predicted HTH domain antitoxin
VIKLKCFTKLSCLEEIRRSQVLKAGIKGIIKCKSYKDGSFRVWGKNNIDHQRRKKKTVIDLYYNQRKTTREIAKIERMSIRDISIILKEEESKRQKYKIIIYVVLVSYCILDNTFFR